MLSTTSDEKDLNGPTSSSSQSRSPFGSKIFKLLITVSAVGIIAYFFIFVGSNPIKSTPIKTKISPENVGKVTVVMNTFKRNDLMTDALDYYSACDLVQNIYVVWSEKAPPPQSVVNKYSGASDPKVHFNIQQVDSLNNRFAPLTGPHSDAIFSVDDDMRVPCSELLLAYQVWRGSSHSLIGFMPRLHLRSGAANGKDSSGKLVYRCWWRVWWHGRYSIILTKAALLHHDFLLSYTNNMPQTVRDLVDRSRNCEDIAMQFLMANSTGLPPIYVKGHLSDLGVFNGLSTNQNIASAGHMDARSQCLNDLEAIYGHNPLVESSVVVDSGLAGWWANEPSTWFEFISSDLWNFF